MQAQTPDDSVTPAKYAEAAQAPNDPERARQAAMIRQLARHRGGQPAALAQIIQLSAEFDDATAAEMIDELASAHLAAGNLNLAAETRQLLAERYPGQPMAHRSILWLVRMYASSEIAHARREESPGAAALRRQLVPEVADALSEAPATINEDGSAVRATKPAEPDQLSLYALHLATRAMGKHAALADDPALAFQRAVAARRAGQDKAAQAFLSPLNHRSAADAWGQCARTEEWLQELRDEAPPKPVIACRAAAAPPHLDGLLEELCWQGASISGGAGDSTPGDRPLPADVRWAYDDSYLYVALQCQKLSGVAYAADDAPRPHDGGVDAHDHVRLCVDVDRDYASWYELAVDHRGWTGDRCCGDARWNPQWFVARGESAAGAAWTIEAAIPLEELSTTKPTAGSAWALAAKRFAPNQTADDGLGVEPEEFSLLLFE